MVRVVSRSRSSEIPSTPTAYWMPQASIHGTAPKLWNAAVPVSKVKKRGTERANSRTVTHSATCPAFRSGAI